MPQEHRIRRIAHLDMDAFYASVELLRYPQLKGLPVVIGGGRSRLDKALSEKYSGVLLADIPVDAFPTLSSYTGRGVITTATYPARQFGIGSAMGLMKAAKLCPQAILLPVDFAQYRHYSQQFKSTVAELAPVMQDRGVDEVYMDITDVPGGQRAGGRSLARLIQKTIFDATGLTCSVGVAPNKLLAKMASEFNKPNGISILFDTDLQSQIWPLPVRKINGIGPKAQEKLSARGIFTIGDLAAHPANGLIEHFGKNYGAWLHEAAWGRDERPVETESEPVSMSRETTFDKDLHAVHDKAALSTIFTQLCDSVAADLQRKGYLGKTIGIKLRYGNFKIVTRDITLSTATDSAALIRRTAGLALKRADLRQRFRLLGVRVGKLEAKHSLDNTPAITEHRAQPATKSVAGSDSNHPELF
jgi:DNA polymerase IV